MSSIWVSIIALLFISGGAVGGMLLRGALPEHYVTENSKDVIKVAMTTVATLVALVLGLLVSSAKSSFDSKEAEIRESAARVILLDRLLVSYGPETKQARDLLRVILATRMKQVWQESGHVMVAEAVAEGEGIETVQRTIMALSPTNDTQRWAKSAALQIISEIAAMRWLFFEQTSSILQWPFLIILVFWLVVIFGSFGLFAPRNGGVIAALLLAALSMTAAIYLVLELDQPYRGLIKISSYPLQMALHKLETP